MDESNPIVSVVALQREVSTQEVQWRDQITRIAAGDESALAELYDSSSRLVYSLALRILPNPTDAEEVALDVYSQVWRNANRFESQRGSVMAWLVTITRSRSIDRLRSQRNQHLVASGEKDLMELATTLETPESQTVEKESVRYVRRALDDLPIEQRDAILLAFFNGLSHPEVADHLGIPLGTVKTRIRLGMSKLRDSLSVLRMEARRAS
jgi:RNA polymerase sigma-70 factor, ECF subfamily